MIRALYTAASGMNAQQLNMDNVANNLANVNTAGFKKSRVEFQDLVYQEMRAAGTQAFATVDAGPHVKVLARASEAARVRDAMRAAPGVERVIEARPGEGARLVDEVIT